MYVRCAFFEGTVDAQHRERFNSFINTELVPLLRQFPGLRDLRILRPEWSEDGAPQILLQTEMLFDSKEALERALDSDVRRKSREVAAEILPLFKGRLYHINYETDCYPGTAS